MPVTLRDLLEVPELDLTLLTGRKRLGVSLRCVHTSELVDPTPWLVGKELLLTTGMSLKGADIQRRYIERLVEAGVAGLGFGIGFGFRKTPKALVEAARSSDFPLLEVPYPVPFIAIAEAVSSQQSDDRVREAQLSVEVHERFSHLVSEGAGPADVLDRLSELTRGWSVLFGRRGEVVARAAAAGSVDVAEVWDKLPPGLRDGTGPAASADSGPSGTRIAIPVRSGRHPEGVLVLGKEHPLEARDRIAVHHGAALLGLLLASRRVALAAERRVAGDVVQEAFSGELSGKELARRLELTGFPSDPVTAIVIQDIPMATPEAAEQVLWTVEGSLAGRCGVARAVDIAESVAALVPAAGALPAAKELLTDLEGLATGRPKIRIGIGTPVQRAAARQSYLAAMFALKAAPEEVSIASPEEMGAYRFLLGGQPESVLADLARRVLGPLVERDTTRGSELLESVAAFVEAGGRWETGAEALGVHRHTLRYRIQQVEEILGRDLASPHTQLEILLALKAREILGA